jgi:hypothetical protein
LTASFVSINTSESRTVWREQTTASASCNIDPSSPQFNYKKTVSARQETQRDFTTTSSTISVYSKLWNNETDFAYMTIDFLTDPECREAVAQSSHACSNTQQGKREAASIRHLQVADLYLKGGYYMDNDMRAVEAIVFQTTFSSRRYSKATNKTFPVLPWPARPRIQLRKAFDAALVTTTASIADQKEGHLRETHRHARILRQLTMTARCASSN